MNLETLERLNDRILSRLFIGKQEDWLSDKDAEDYAEVIHQNPALQSISFGDAVEISERGALRLIEAAATCPKLHAFELPENVREAPAVHAAMDEHFANAPHAHHYTRLVPSTPRLDSQLIDNKLHKQRLYKTLSAWQDKRTKLSTNEILQINHWRVVVKTSSRGGIRRMKAFDDFVGRLPKLPEELTPDALFKRNPLGYCPLDNPRLWEKAAPHQTLPDFSQICEELAAHGTPITLEQLMGPSSHGGPLLPVLMAHADPDVLLPALQTCNITLRDEIFEESTRKASPLFNMLIANGQSAINTLFRAENWEGASTQEVNAGLRLVPEAMRQKIPNRHTLLASASRPAERSL